ncbi:hypothetical protein F503_06712 [Ophiostoma piceae UAMH 11346]|uniref:Uncharacterized protein n=1 Tax=Ophiostoma piceae (strain UAMH 11346) TaxID=1262450 RepID=S3BQC9_OPHP1|nr:hypothetical protein F503_06712 [Ophiostoma piceae UAMH 11346]
MPPDESLPPYQPPALLDAANAADDTSDDAAEPPSYEDAPSTSQQSRNASSNGNTSRLSLTNPFRSRASANAHTPDDDNRLDEKNRLIRQHNQQAHPNQPPPGYFASSSTDCPHWVERRCRLTARPRQCCTCMDKRPYTEDGRYPVYMDGYSELGSVVRWAHYCEPCRKAESRLHKCYDTKARPPPGQNAYRAPGNEQARVAREMADKKLQIELSQDPDGGLETTMQRKQRDQKERQERKERRRELWEATKEAAEKELDDAWEADQLQRMSKGESVSCLTVRRHFLMAHPNYHSQHHRDRDTEGKGKGKGKRVVGTFGEYMEPPTAEPGVNLIMKPITTAEVREARKTWEASSNADERERKRWEENEAHHVQEILEAVRNAARDAEQRHYEDMVAAKQRNEYEAYGDGAKVHWSVSRIISRGSSSRRADASSSLAPDRAGGGSSSSSSTSEWLSRLFGRRDARQ